MPLFLQLYKRKAMRRVWTGLIIVFALVGCVGDEFDTDRIVNDVELTAGMNLPLAKANITMGDILSDATDQVKYYQDEDGNERIMFYQYKDSVESIGINQFMKMSMAPVDVPVPFIFFKDNPVLATNFAVPLSIPDAKLSLLGLSYDLSISGSNLKVPLLVTIDFPTANIGSGGKVLTFEVYNNQTSVQSSVNDLFEIVNDKMPARISIKPLSPIEFFDSSSGSLSIAMKNTVINYMKGSIAECTIQLKEGQYDLDFDVLEEVPGDVVFANPKLNIIIRNETPYVGAINADLKGELEDQPFVELNAPPVIFPAYQADQKSLTYNYSLDKSNSNLSEFVSKKPSSLWYGGQLVINPDGINANEVELSADDLIQVGYGIEVPLDLKLNGLIEMDTIDIADMEVIDDLTEATLIFNSNNGFPFRAKANLSFYDQDTDAILETLDINIVKSAEVDPVTGIVSTKVANTENVVLTDIQMESLRRSEQLRVSLEIQTSNYDTGQSVVLLRNNELELQLSIKGKIEQN